MNVVNPNVAAPASPVTAQDKTDLQALLAGVLAANAAPSFDDIRAAIPPAARARFSDGLIHQIAKDLALTVLP